MLTHYNKYYIENFTTTKFTCLINITSHYTKLDRVMEIHIKNYSHHAKKVYVSFSTLICIIIS